MMPAAFDVAVGLSVQSLVQWLSVSGFSEAPRRRRRWMVGLLIYVSTIEAIQQFRSIDPDSRMPSRQADRQRSGTQQLRQPADVVSRLP